MNLYLILFLYLLTESISLRVFCFNSTTNKNLLLPILFLMSERASKMLYTGKPFFLVYFLYQPIILITELRNGLIYLKKHSRGHLLVF